MRSCSSPTRDWTCSTNSRCAPFSDSRWRLRVKPADSSRRSPFRTQFGVTRSAVNLMVHDGRLPARRVGHRWVASAKDVECFRASYQPARSAGRKLGPRGGQPEMVEVVLDLLRDW